MADPCGHHYDGNAAEPPVVLLTLNGQRCSYCGCWLKGTLWQCTLCGAYCHAKCVPDGQRLSALRRAGAGTVAVGAEVFLRCSRAAVHETGDVDIDDVHGAPVASYSVVERASADLSFEFPSGLPEHSDDNRIRMSALTMLRDAVSGRLPSAGLPIYPRALARAAAMHHRRYLRSLRDGALVLSSGVRELCADGMRYARGAYGNGRLTNGTFFQTFVRAVDFDPSAYMDGALGHLGWGGTGCGELLHWCWRPRKGGACPTPGYFIGADRARRRGVIGLRGTLYAEDVEIDANASAADFLGGCAHNGMRAAAEQVLEDVRHVLGRNFAAGASSEFAGWPVVVCGHSLGGGVAACLVLLLRRHCDLDVTGVAFGPPPCLSDDLAAELDPCFTTVVYGKDAVSRLTVPAVADFVDEVSGMPAPAAAAAASAAAILAACLSEGAAPPSPAASGLPRAADALPGAVHVIHTAAADGAEADYLVRVPAGEVSLYRVRGRQLGGLLLSRDMLLHHLPAAYCEITAALLNQRYSSRYRMTACPDEARRAMRNRPQHSFCCSPQPTAAS
eukprot:TRINITY_DN107_c1_g1_i1.p1 TRINITY_DN107_c1_g1~~TRINITY_DN107_c1_g1_i1.p1  ORF type:complete len:574 (+),score=184.64 TRINITY_DN107_c1_g1_i1:44-1723(+)